MTVHSERVGSVVLLTIDRPEVRNALDRAAIEALTAHVEAAGADGGVAGLVLTGNGAFCAGGDLRHVVEVSETSSEVRRGTVEKLAQGLIRALVALPVPTVAAIDGPAVGMGFDIALACDSRLIGPSGWCMQGWGRVGVIPGTGGELLLRRLNPAALWRMLEHQPRIAGPDAERWNLGEDVAVGTARDAALARMAALAELPRSTLLAYVELHREGLRSALGDHLARSARIQADLLADPCFGERVGRLVGGTRR